MFCIKMLRYYYAMIVSLLRNKQNQTKNKTKNKTKNNNKNKTKQNKTKQNKQTNKKNKPVACLVYELKGFSKFWLKVKV